VTKHRLHDCQLCLCAAGLPSGKNSGRIYYNREGMLAKCYKEKP